MEKAKIVCVPDEKIEKQVASKSFKTYLKPI